MKVTLESLIIEPLHFNVALNTALIFSWYHGLKDDWCCPFKRDRYSPPIY